MLYNELFNIYERSNSKLLFLFPRLESTFLIADELLKDFDWQSLKNKPPYNIQEEIKVTLWQTGELDHDRCELVARIIRHNFDKLIHKLAKKENARQITDDWQVTMDQ